MTASVLLDPQREISHGKVFHKWNKSVGVHLGDRDDRSLVAVHAGIAVDREPIMLASEVENLEGPVVEE